MSHITRSVLTFAAIATGLVLISSTASADRQSDCSEARSFLRSDATRRTCSSRYHSARSLFCSSASGQRLLLSMARSCRARAASAPSSSGGGTTDTDPAKKGPEKTAETTGTKVEDIPVCKAYLARVVACTPAKGPVSRQEEANIKKRELQEKLNKGSKVQIIGGACQALDKVLKCS